MITLTIPLIIATIQRL